MVVCTKLKGVQDWSDGVMRSLGVRRVLARPVRFPVVADVLEQVMAELTATMAAIPAIDEIAAREGLAPVNPPKQAST